MIQTWNRGGDRAPSGERTCRHVLISGEKLLSERREDTPERPEAERSERPRGSYYYDDATGYEVYTPEEDGEEETIGDGGEAASP
jgi:hypothetical protein